MNPLKLIIVPYNRAKHLVNERSRLAQLEMTIETIRTEHARSKNRNMIHFERIYNAGLYMLLFEYDMAILKNDALFSIRAWKKKYVARQYAILLYEASQDIPKLLGKDFRTSLKEIGISDEEQEQFNRITKGFGDFKRKNQPILQELRNYVGAHRDKDAATQLDIINRVDLISVMELAADFYVSINALMAFLISTTTKMGDMQVIARHIFIGQKQN